MDKIHLVTGPDAWNYVGTSVNPADVGTRENSIKNPDTVSLWRNAPKFLLKDEVLPKAPYSLNPVVRLVSLHEKSMITYEIKALDQLIESSRDIYTFKKRVAYLMAFTSFAISKAKKTNFEKPNLDACYHDRTLLKVVKYSMFSHRTSGPRLRL